MQEHRDTLGMPDIMEEYPVPGPRTLDGVLGFRVLELGEDSASGEVAYADRICQRFGVVHGGTYSAFAEMLATEATVHNVWALGRGAMGSSNSTWFMRPITEGTIHVAAKARHRGRTTWVWDIDFSDDDGRLCASSRITIAVRPRPE